MRGRLDEAATYFTESDVHARQTEHQNIRGTALSNRAELARMQGDVALAITLAEEGLLLAQLVGITFVVARQTTMLGRLAQQQGNYALAKARYWEALALYRTFGSPNFTAGCLEGLAIMLCAEGRYESATRLCAAAVALREQAQTPLPPADREAFEQTIAMAQTALDEAAFGTEWTAGTAFTQNEAIKDALSVSSRTTIT